MIVAWIACALAAPADPVAVPAVPLPGHAIVVGTATTAEEGAKLAAAYRLGGNPTHGDWPHVVVGAAIGVSEPASFLVVAAIPRDPNVAEKLVAHLKKRGLEARDLAATSGGEELQMLSIDGLRATGSGTPLFVFRACLALAVEPIEPGSKKPRDRVCMSETQPYGDEKLLLPFVALEAPLPVMLVADVGDPWECPAVDMGLTPTDPVWLRGPATATCYASTEKARRRQR